MIFRIRQGEFVAKIPVNTEVDKNKIKIFAPYNAGLLQELKAMDGYRPVYIGGSNGRGGRFSHTEIKLNERNLYNIEILSGKKPHHYTEIEYEPLITDWPLFPHQEEGVHYCYHKYCAGMGFIMGLGKTLSSMALMHQVAHYKEKYNWVVVAPTGAQKEWRRQLRKWKAPIEPIAFTTYESLYKVMEKYDVPDGVIFDESIKIANKDSIRSEVAAQYARNIRQYTNGYVVCLSGSFAPRDPLQWWHQVEVMCPGYIRESSPNKLRDRLAVIEWREGTHGNYPHVVEWKEDEVKAFGKRLSNIILFKDKKDCLDLPDKIYDEIEIDLDQELLDTADLLLETAESAVVGMQRVRQLSDGFLYEHEFNEATGKYDITGYEWLGSPKIQVIRDLLHQYHRDTCGCGRLVIYTPYTAAREKIIEIITDEGQWIPFTVDNVDLDRFEDSEEDNIVIVDHPGKFHGLTLIKTGALVYYSNDFNPDARVQSEERRCRPGMVGPTRIVDIINLPTDRRILDIIKGRKELERLTLDSLKEALHGKGDEIPDTPTQSN